MIIYIGAGATLAQLNYCTTTVHCTENPIYVFPEKKLRSLVPNYYIHVSVRDLYIPRIGLSIWLQQDRQTDTGKMYCKSLTDTRMWKSGDRTL